MLYRVFLIALFCTNAYSQLIYFGVKGGTPLSDSTSSEMVFSRFTGGGLSTLNVRRYTVGPAFEIALPFGLRFEADALYKRLDTTGHGFFNPVYGTITRQSASPWEFPLLLKYPFGHRSYRPFIAAGGTFRRIESLEGSTEVFATGFDPPYSVSRYHIDETLTEGGMVFGGGLRIRVAGPLKITPEIRYTRWRSMRFLPTKNQMEFLLGLGF